jgi:tRNA1Val (adenine37-N6)-methyltransferase
MSSAYFDFKAFRIFHEKSAMKVGTDSVILGAIVPIHERVTRIADIGCGSGLLSLMMAQRCGAQIDAIEIDDAAAQEAAFNFAQSPWHDRLHIHANSFQQHTMLSIEQYDLLISNPPYYEKGKSFPINDTTRLAARHTHALSFLDLVLGAQRMLHAHGEFWLILPMLESQEFIEVATENELFLIAEIHVHAKASKLANRMVMGFSKIPQTKRIQHLVVYKEDGSRSDEYAQLTEAFYL